MKRRCLCRPGKSRMLFRDIVLLSNVDCQIPAARSGHRFGAGDKPAGQGERQDACRDQNWSGQRCHGTHDANRSHATQGNWQCGREGESPVHPLAGVK
jgi:hypothetical protein